MFELDWFQLHLLALTNFLLMSYFNTFASLVSLCSFCIYVLWFLIRSWTLAMAAALLLRLIPAFIFLCGMSASRNVRRPPFTVVGGLLQSAPFWYVVIIWSWSKFSELQILHKPGNIGTWTWSIISQEIIRNITLIHIQSVKCFHTTKNF